MIGGLRVLAIIPARGGSKGLPRKNVLELGGKPLIAWSIEAGSASHYIDRCIVSTDDQEIAATARRFQGDIPFMRPAELAADNTTTLDVTRHALETLPGYDVVVILQPTSPLRITEDIDATIEKMVTLQASSCVSVVEPSKSPYWAYGTDEHHRLTSLIDPQLATRRRQELPDAYVLNGAVYAARTDWLLNEQAFVGENTVAHVMPAERSLDIDTAFDLKMVAFFLHEAQQASKPLAANA